MMEPSTLAQRNYLSDLYKRLNWKLPEGWKNKTKQKTSELIKEAKQALSQCPTQDRAIYSSVDRDNELGNDPGEW